MANEKLDLISRNALMEQFDDSFKGFVMKRIIEMQPTVDAVEVKHGRWIYVDGKGTNAEYECNKCHKHVCFDEKIDGSIPAYKFRPNCGAKMDGGNEDGSA